MSNPKVTTPEVTGQLQEIIAKQAVLAFNEGYDTGLKEGIRGATRDTFDEVNAILSDLYEYFYNDAGHREAICEAQAKVEALQEKLAAQLGFE